MSLGIKEIVSKNKLRYKEDGFDLDLSYIARNIIAMGFPAEALERFYRNNINDVAKFFEIKHKGCYKIYNLCSESKRRYDISKFNGMVVEEYSFQDHNPPPFRQLKPFCESVHRWLSNDSNNVAAIHCKAGKGRTGVMICAYLIYAGKCEDLNGKLIDIPDAESALEYYGRQRTRDLKGVTIPSQKRYVYYFEYLVKHNLEYRPVRLRLMSLILTSLPVYNGGAFTLICEIHQIPKQKIKSFDIEMKKGSKNLIFNLPEPLLMQGDIKIEFYIKKIKKEKIFQFCFNTFFVEHGTDTCTVSTESCSNCSNGGQKITLIACASHNKQSNMINNGKQQQSSSSSSSMIDYLSFLELAKSENLFFACDCNSSLFSSFHSTPAQISMDHIFDPQHHPLSPSSNYHQQPDASSTNSGCCRQQFNIPNITTASCSSTCETNSKMSTTASTTSSTSSSNSSLTQSLLCNNNDCGQKKFNPDLKTSHPERNLYLVLPKDKLENAYKDKLNKTFPANFKVVLRFNHAQMDNEDEPNNRNNMEYLMMDSSCSMNNTNLNSNSNNSESENITSEEDDEPSDQEFCGTNAPGGGGGPSDEHSSSQPLTSNRSGSSSEAITTSTNMERNTNLNNNNDDNTSNNTNKKDEITYL